MNASLTIGRFAGIKVQIHWTFWLLILFVMAILLSRGGTVEQMGWSILFILLLFVCVIFHEFGHALTAKRFDIGTRSITLLNLLDRKSTRLNSSHVAISYAVFCLKKKRDHADKRCEYKDRSQIKRV